MTCSAPGEHRPRAHQTDTHHVLPRSWGGPDVPANRVELCPNHHHNVHDLLNEYIRAGGQPTAAVLRTFTKLEQQLAAEAWAQRPNDHPPYTLTHPEDPYLVGEQGPELTRVTVAGSVADAQRVVAATQLALQDAQDRRDAAITGGTMTATMTPTPTVKPMWLDVLERAGWTFAQSFLALEVAAGEGWYNRGVAKAAAIAAGAAVLSFLKTVSVKATAS